jgi:NHL repeat
MRSSRVLDLVAGRPRTGIPLGSWWCRGHMAQACLARVSLSVCALTLALGGATAHAQLAPLFSIGTPGSGSGQFQTPIGVAVQQSNGDIYVADSANARIQKFDANGKFKGAWGWGVKDGKARAEVCKRNCLPGIPGSGPGQFANPTSIAIGTKPEKVYVGDAGNNVVLQFTSNGRFKATIDGSTTPNGHFSIVAGVAVDQSGNLWVADGGTNNIIEFDTRGRFVQIWTDPFGQTLGIAVDSTNNAVYLIRGSQATERFTLTGENETIVDGGLAVALGIDPQTGNLYVDHGGDVAVYDLTGTQLQSFSLAPTTNSQGIAFHSLSSPGGAKAKGNLYASDASNDDVLVFGPPPPGPPIVSAESASGTGLTTATLKAVIVPLGLPTTCTFQFVASADFLANGYANATSVPCTPASLGSGFGFQQATADLSGLTLGAFYHFRAIATNSAGTSTGADQTFQVGPGFWTPYFRCPVDDPAMLATDGVNTEGVCVASNSSHGSITIGNLTTPTGNINLQLGVVATAAGEYTAVAPPDGAIVAAPAQITVGTAVVTATVEPAGAPSNFSLVAGLGQGEPIVTLPIKIHLESQGLGLGPDCFIGSDQDPIVLNPENTDLLNSTFFFTRFNATGNADPNGLLETVVIGGAVQGDSSFAVPAAQGCGTNDSLDALVNAVAGLPSPAGNNNLVLDDASSAVVLVANGTTGPQFSSEWHTAFGTTTTTTTTSTTTTTMMGSPSSAFIE